MINKVNDAVDASNLNLVVECLKSKKSYPNSMFNNFKVTESIYFQDMIWDFNFMNTNNRSKALYRFNFNRIPEPYMFFIKHIIINEKIFKKNGFVSCHNVFGMLHFVTNQLYSHGITDVYLVNKNIIVDFIDKYEKNVSLNRLESICIQLTSFLSLLSQILDYNYDNIIVYLRDKAKDCRSRNLLYTAKNEYIPDSFLDQTVSLAIKDMNNVDLPLSHRIIACILILIAETGIRAEEATLLEANMLDTVYIESLDKDVNYLKFKTFKTHDGIEEYKSTYTWLTPLATKAYKTCQDLMSHRIDNLNEISKLRLLIILAGYEDKLYTNIRLSKLRELVDALTPDELKNAISNSKKYIFIDGKTGIQKRSSHVIRDNILSFYIRYCEDFNLDSISKSQLENLKEFQFTNESKFKKEFTAAQRKNINYEDIKNKKYIFVNPHMFRVTVCTKLFLSNVHIDFIVKHMNHLSEDMTVYYNKSTELKDNLSDAIKILSLMSKDADGLIETNTNNIESETYKSILSDDLIKENINKINDFLLINNLNIITDIDKIIKKLEKFSAPLAENDFGVCINIITQNICDKRDSFSSDLGSYYVNVSLPTYRNINYSYDVFKNKLQIINHNKKISDSNPNFRNEYERELNALKYFIDTRLEKEITLLEYDINNNGIQSVINKYPDLDFIVENIVAIKEELHLWRS